VWAQTDASTCTISVIEKTNSATWPTFTTNAANIIADTDGTNLTTFTDATVGIDFQLGVKIENTDSTCSNVTVRAKVTY
jgi:hypothetical protein